MHSHNEDRPLPLGLDRESLEIKQGQYLPHWTCQKAVYHVTMRLVDSLPKPVLDEWLRERQTIPDNAQLLDRELSENERARLQYLFSERVDTYLDQAVGDCWLEKREIADLVAGAIRFFDGDRYCLHAWGVMPSHLHLVVEPLTGNGLKKITAGLMSYTATMANRALGRSGAFWQPEPYDHIIRTEREYLFQLDYVYDNPAKAGLGGWRWRWKADAH